MERGVGQALVGAGAKPTVTCLLSAVEFGSTHLISYLISECDIQPTPSLLFRAIIIGNQDIVKMLWDAVKCSASSDPSNEKNDSFTEEVENVDPSHLLKILEKDGSFNGHWLRFKQERLQQKAEKQRRNAPLEVRKNARIIFQATRSNTSFFSTLPMKVNQRIVSLTGNLDMLTEQACAMITRKNFSAPGC